jgi:hypothetical protein
MKTVYLFLMISVLTLGSCGHSKKQPAAEGNNSKIEFENKTFDFGKIAYASDGTCSFRFKNVSDNPLIVNVVRTTCGCTNPEWPKEVIPPDSTGVITVTYNTRIPGTFHKGITVYSNSVNSPVKLLITGEVEQDPNFSTSSSKK